jgi:hypothetical protein
MNKPNVTILSRISSSKIPISGNESWHRAKLHQVELVFGSNVSVESNGVEADECFVCGSDV